ncbi:MAG: diaminopimelate decarboxylase [Pseudomonadota bacterium]|nr:diaminopimelate decarboxylase [Pseudomonadota bacterium]
MQSFSYINNILHCEKVSIREVCKKIKTPFYLYSSKAILDNFSILSKKFKGSNVLIAYAVKANSNLAILRLLAKKGAGADVVSYGELIRAFQAGIPAKKIVFSGVGKTDFEISYAIENKILQFNIESDQELLVIEKIAREKKIKANISIRINPDIQAGGHPKISTGKKTDKFGISINKALQVYVQAKNSPYLNIVGVDMHIGSQILQIKPFKESFKKIEKFCTLLESKNIKIKNLDLGGGLGINYSNTSSNDITLDYIDLVNSISKRTRKKVIIEPGRYLVANSGILVATVIYKKQNENKKFIITNAGMNDFLRPALYNAKHNVGLIQKELYKDTSEKFDVVGPICETADVMIEDASLSYKIDRGDIIFIDNVGAYGAAMSSTYNSRGLISEVLVKDNTFFQIRKNMKPNEFIKLEKIPTWLK